MSNPNLEPGEAYADVNGVRLCWQAFGREGDPPMLLVAGLGVQMIQWEDDFCESLAARGYRVIRFDNRDIGKSSWIDFRPGAAEALAAAQRGEPLQAPYLLKDMAADGIGLLDHLGVERAHVVGSSMGGMIAQEMAIRWPERVATLASIMSTTGEPGLPTATPEAMAAITAPQAATVEDYVKNGVEAARVLRNGGFPEEDARAEARARRAARRGLNPEGGGRHFLALMASGSRAKALAGVRAPTLVIHGADDPLIRVEAGRATARAILGAKMLEIERMGHALPKALWARIVDAIAENAQ